jgi:hypothetical protein
MTTETTTEHPIVAEALEHLAEMQRQQDQTRADLVAGSPVSPADLAAVSAAVEHAELLVERARHEAARADQRSATTADLAEEITAAAAAVDGDPVAVVEAQLAQAVEAMSAVWDAAAANTATVGSLAGRVERIDKADRARHGVGLGSYSNDVIKAVRTRDVVLPQTPPVSVLAAAFLEVLASHDIDGRDLPAQYADLPRLLRFAAAGWGRAVEERQIGPVRS